MCGAPERVIRQKDDVCVLVRRVRACVVRVDVCVCSCAPQRERIRYEGPDASAAGKAAERGTGRLYVGGGNGSFCCFGVLWRLAEVRRGR